MAVVRVAISVAPGAAVAARDAAAGTPTGRTVIREYLDAFIVAGLVALLLITFVVRTFYIPSASMEPTLQIHDVLLVNEFEYKFAPPHREDIVVFEPPVVSPDNYIKRVIGAPGDTLAVHDGVVIRNGLPLTEPYEAQKPAYEMEVKNYGIYVDGTRLDPELANIPSRDKWVDGPDKIPAGCYWMMGDNRNDSQDSHIWGFAQPSGEFASGQLRGRKASFTGHAFVLFWPFNRVRILR